MRAAIISISLLLGVSAWAQEDPRGERVSPFMTGEEVEMEDSAPEADGPRRRRASHPDLSPPDAGGMGGCEREVDGHGDIGGAYFMG